MAIEIPDLPVPDEWWEPLLAVETRMRESPRLLDRCFAIDDFMLMGRDRRRSRPLVYLYKHRDTRRYLNVDVRLNAYRYVPPRRLTDGGGGSYRRLTSLEEGVDGVGLWELPRFRPDLVAQRLGIPERELRVLVPRNRYDALDGLDLFEDAFDDPAA
jgi:hypothetical protein